MYIRAKNIGESGSKAQSYYSAEQARESGTLGGMLPQESISTTTFLF